MNLPEKIRDLSPDLIAWRRHLHAHPELGYEEYQTQSFIMQTLESMGLTPQKAGGTGVVVDLGARGSRVLARADIDALPIDEETDVEYRSVNPGAMHACGHDGHVAIMLGVARILPELLAQDGGQARLIFQPAEERHPGGALNMIEDGVLEGVSRVTGLHLQAEMATGRIGARVGAQSANSDRFRIVVHGRGGHGSMPHATVDPVPVVGQLIGAMQTLVARMVDPTQSAVVTIGSVQSGSAYNAIPSAAEIRGTVRTFNQGVRDNIESRLARMVEAICEASGARGELDYMRGYPSVVNTEREFEVFRDVVEEQAPDGTWQDVPELMIGEDFAYYLEQRPGVFWNLGAQVGDNPYPHHHGRFTFNESVMPLGVWIMARTIIALSHM